MERPPRKAVDFLLCPTGEQKDRPRDRVDVEGVQQGFRVLRRQWGHGGAGPNQYCFIELHVVHTTTTRARKTFMNIYIYIYRTRTIL